ncbi:MAG: hypothetical protein JW976_13395 [Syntrophaceae bacterium]|nr:hypothetical protein [Syntrophaceae bacterium]
MIKNEEIESFNRGWRTLNIAWVAMLMSLFIYLFVGLYSEDIINLPMEKAIFDKLRNILFVVSFFTLIAIKYIKNLILSGKGLNIVKTAQQQSNQNAPNPAIARYTVATMIALAMSESVAIYGLVLFFLGKNKFDLYLLILISAAAMFYYRPKKEEAVGTNKESKQF